MAWLRLYFEEVVWPAVPFQHIVASRFVSSSSVSSVFWGLIYGGNLIEQAEGQQEMVGPQTVPVLRLNGCEPVGWCDLFVTFSIILSLFPIMFSIILSLFPSFSLRSEAWAQARLPEVRFD